MENKNTNLKEKIQDGFNLHFDDDEILSKAYAEMDRAGIRAKKQPGNVNKKKRKLSPRNKALAIGGACLAVLLLVGIMTPVVLRMIAFNNDYITRAYAKNKIITTQYTPNINILTTSYEWQIDNDGEAENSGTTPLNSDNHDYNENAISENSVLSLKMDVTKEDYENIIKEKGVIDTGRTNDPNTRFRSVYEIRDELYRVMNIIPRFNHWYFEDVDYGHYYYAEISENKDRLSLTRVTHDTATYYYDFEKGIIVHDNGRKSCVQNQIIKVTYYFDEADREVVEFEVLNYFRHYNGDFIPLSYQMVKNIKDTSFTKIDIDSAADLYIYNNKYEGHDIRGTNPYGVQRRFTQLDYTSADDIQLLKIDQLLPYDLPEAPAAGTMIRYYNKNGADSVYYSTWYDYKKTDSLTDMDNYAFTLWQNRFDHDDYVSENFTTHNNLGINWAIGRPITEKITSGDTIQRKFTGFVSMNAETGILVTPHFQNSYNERKRIYSVELNSNMYSGLEYSFRGPEDFPIFVEYNEIIPDSESFVIRAQTNTLDLAEVAAIQNNEKYPLSEAGNQALNNVLGINIALTNTLASIGNAVSVSGNASNELKDSAPVSFSFDDTSFAFESSIDRYLDSISKHIVDSSYLKANMKKIHKEKDRAWRYKINENNVSALSEINKLEDFSAGAATVLNNYISFDARATVAPSIALDSKADYSLSLAMKNESGDYYILQNLGTQKYNKDNTMVFDVSVNCNLSSVSGNLHSGKYTLGLVLTTNNGTRDIVCSDFKPVFIEDFEDIESISYVYNGLQTNIAFEYDGADLTINVFKVDIEKPVINCTAADNILILGNDGLMLKIFEHFTFSDNDRIVKIEIRRQDGKIVGFNEPIKKGNFVLFVEDRTGNSAYVNFSIV